MNADRMMIVVLLLIALTLYAWLLTALKELRQAQTRIKALTPSERHRITKWDVQQHPEELNHEC